MHLYFLRKHILSFYYLPTPWTHSSFVSLLTFKLRDKIKIHEISDLNRQLKLWGLTLGRFFRTDRRPSDHILGTSWKKGINVELIWQLFKCLSNYNKFTGIWHTYTVLNILILSGVSLNTVKVDLKMCAHTCSLPCCLLHTLEYVWA